MRWCGGVVRWWVNLVRLVRSYLRWRGWVGLSGERLGEEFNPERQGRPAQPEKKTTKIRIIQYLIFIVNLTDMRKILQLRRLLLGYIFIIRDGCWIT